MGAEGGILEEHEYMRSLLGRWLRVDISDGRTMIGEHNFVILLKLRKYFRSTSLRRSRATHCDRFVQGVLAEQRQSSRRGRFSARYWKRSDSQTSCEEDMSPGEGRRIMISTFIVIFHSHSQFSTRKVPLISTRALCFAARLPMYMSSGRVRGA